MTPQEHYDEAERLLSDSVLVGANQAGDPALHLALSTEALAHATLALAGFTRDAATGADHVHGFICGDRAERDTEPGRPA
jgi:hypothetical protein